VSQTEPKNLCPICASEALTFAVDHGGRTVGPSAAFECKEGCKISVEGVEPVRRLRHLVMWSAA
jgi:hypothetical protein